MSVELAQRVILMSNTHFGAKIRIYYWILSVMLCTLGKIFSRQHIEIFFLFFFENRFWYFMQTVSNGDSLHEMSNLVFFFQGKENRFWHFMQTVSNGAQTVCMKCQIYFKGKIRTISSNLSSAGLAQRVVKVNGSHEWGSLCSSWKCETLFLCELCTTA